MEQRHLKITVESDGKNIRLIEARVIPTRLPAPGVVVGTLAYAASEDGKMKWADTMQDPFVHRAIPRRGKHEHAYTRTDKAVFDLRIPLPERGLAPDFTIDVVIATADMPRSVAELPALFERQAAKRRRRLGKVDLGKLQRLPEWGRLKSEAGLKIRGERSAK